MTDDCIKREDAINTIRNTFTGMTADTLELRINDIPSADVAPVRHGKWMKTGAYPHRVYCSVCSRTYAQAHWEVWKDGSLARAYCPNCGAKMDGGDTDA